MKPQKLPEMLEQKVVTAASFEFDSTALGMHGEYQTRLRVTVTPENVTVHDMDDGEVIDFSVNWDDLRGWARLEHESKRLAVDARLNFETGKAFLREAQCILAFKRKNRPSPCTSQRCRRVEPEPRPEIVVGTARCDGMGIWPLPKEPPARGARE